MEKGSFSWPDSLNSFNDTNSRCKRFTDSITEFFLTLFKIYFSMSIWFKPYTIADIQWMLNDNMCETIGIEITELTPDSIKGRMPVDKRTVQPMKILHGGASVALAESLGSVGSNLIVDNSKYVCVGLDINANHL